MHRADFIFHLDIRRLPDRRIGDKIRKYCEFTLLWGKDSRLPVELEYPPTLDDRYNEWQQAYINYYKARPSTPQDLPPFLNTNLRAEVITSGMLTPLKEKRDELIRAENYLLDLFLNWLQDGRLWEIRETLEEACTKLEADSEQVIDVFLTCHRNQDPTELAKLPLAKLPWEAWKISKKLERSGKIRIARTSVSRTEPAQVNTVRRSWARILAIWVEDKYLNLEKDIDTLRHDLGSSVEIQILRINSKQSSKQILEQISTKISEEQGWDILFFAGHSGEARVDGGKLQFPGFSIAIKALELELEQAIKRGLQFAIFNSCNGLDIAESLLSLGFNQVVVMREAIADDVANEFLGEFASKLKSNHDTHASVIKARDTLLQSQQYPSAHLIPCLFRRPGSRLFQIPSRRRRWLRLFRPKRYEIVALSLITLASLLTPLQQGLLDKRVYAQAVHRDILHSVPEQPQAPAPLVLLQIDENSIKQAMKEAGSQIRNPLPQGYLSKLITELGRKKPKVVGIDYLLDQSQGNQGRITRRLGDVIAAATNQETRFVFFMGLSKNLDDWIPSLPEITGNNVANANGFRSYGSDYHIPILLQETQPLPFSYWLTWFHRTCIQLKNQEHQAFCKAPTKQIYQAVVEKEALEDVVKISPRLNELEITAVGRRLKQQWLHPITDFSIPPSEVYELVTAKKFLKNPNNYLAYLPQQTVLIAPKYDGAGIDSPDSFPAPSAIAYRNENSVNFWPKMSGGEHHAYLFYLFLNNRLVVPIPDLWIVWVVAIAGKSIVLLLQQRRASIEALPQTIIRKQDTQFYQSPLFWALLSGTIMYCLLSLELYFSSVAILLPIVLPVAVFWFYVLPPLIKREI